MRELCGGAALRAESFARPLTQCDLARCQGTCCTSGATLNPEEALVIAQLARRHGDVLRGLAPELPAEPVVRDADGAARTARVPRAYRGVVPGYPAHFPDLACAFLTPTARCALQELAVARGADPWAYKPLACWLHPVRLTADEIVLPDARTDPHPGGFASCTPCGRAPGGGGRPAAEVLGAELARLGAWLGRDLLGELDGGPRGGDAPHAGGASR